MVITETKQMPDTFSPHLRQVVINGQGLPAAPPQLFELKQLVKLDLSHNKITGFEKASLDLKHLTSIILSHNDLTEIPDFCFRKTVRNLNVSHNRIKRVPNRVYKLKGISLLNLSHNHIASVDVPVLGLLLTLGRNIPPYLHHLRTLLDLRLDNNRLTSLPSDFAWFPSGKFKRLDLHSNRFIEVEKGSGLPSDVLELGPLSLKEVCCLLLVHILNVHSWPLERSLNPR